MCPLLLIVGIKKIYGGGVRSSAITFITRYLNTEVLLQTLKQRAYRHTQKHHGDLVSLHSAFME
jgi:hypothetical protein